MGAHPHADRLLFAAALRLGAPDRQVSFSVPTGNFGDIYAGYLAKQMGLPVDQLVVATNQNDILHRFISNNDYSKTQLSKTYSPSMDILVSSNFERYLFDLFGRDSAQLTDFMLDLVRNVLASVNHSGRLLKRFLTVPASAMRPPVGLSAKLLPNLDKLLDPHTAIGVESGRLTRKNAQVPMITWRQRIPQNSAKPLQLPGWICRNCPLTLPICLSGKSDIPVIANDLGEVSAFISAALGQQALMRP